MSLGNGLEGRGMYKKKTPQGKGLQQQAWNF